MRGVRRLALAIMLAMGAVSGAEAAQSRELERMLAGESQLQGRALERALERAAAHPLGSRENPVRAFMPPGQRAYLSRLRCSDGSPPQFEREGNVGPGPYRNIVDLYRVDCGEAAPGTVSIHIDMYHRDHVEERPVQDFTIVPAADPPPTT